MRCESGRKIFAFQGASIYNNLPSDVRNEKYFVNFKRKINTLCFQIQNLIVSELFYSFYSISCKFDSFTLKLFSLNRILVDSSNIFTEKVILHKYDI